MGMSEQCDQLNKIRSKMEKDKMAVRMQVNDTRAATDHVGHEQAVADKNLKALQGQLGTLCKKIDESTGVLADYDGQNKRMMAENSNQYSRLEDMLNNVSMLQKVKINLSSQLDDIKRMCDDEAKERQSLLGKFRTLEHEYDGVKEHFDDEMQQKEEAGRQLQKMMADANHWRSKYENDAMGKIEELEMTKLKLQARLAESEGTMENLNSKLMVLEKAKLQVTKDIEDMVHRVDQVNIMYNQAEEFEGTRRNHAKAMEQMQYAIEQESKAKAEAMRLRKKLELDIGELDSALDHANMANMELQKSIKNYQDKTRDKTAQFEAEQQAKDSAKEYLMTAERRAHGAQNALEETKTMLEQADRSRRQAEQDLADSHENLADLTVQNQGFVSAKRKLESDLADLRGEAEEAKGEAAMADDRAKKFMMDAASLAEELRSEQEQAQALEKDRREQEAKTKDLQVQLDDAETNAIKWGRKMVQKMDARCRELEAELDSEQRRMGDAHKNFRKAERGIKEFTFKEAEDRKNAERMSDLVEKLQQQIKTYKKQIEEAEEIAAINLSKFRKAQVDLTETQERADLTEQAYAKYKARGRSASIARDM